MPYYFTRPVHMALIKFSAKHSFPIAEAVKRIVKERLVQEGFLKSEDECLHKEFYPSTMQRRHYVSICAECGLEIHANSPMEAEVLERMAREKGRKNVAAKCWHEWEYTVMPAGREILRDERGRIVQHIKIPEEKVPTKCRKCGLEYEEVQRLREAE